MRLALVTRDESGWSLSPVKNGEYLWRLSGLSRSRNVRGERRLKVRPGFRRLETRKRRNNACLYLSRYSLTQAPAPEADLFEAFRFAAITLIRSAPPTVSDRISRSLDRRHFLTCKAHSITVVIDKPQRFMIHAKKFNQDSARCGKYRVIINNA